MKVADLFDGVTNKADLAEKFDAFRTALAEAPNTAKGDVALQRSEGGQVLVKTESQGAALTRLLSMDSINKALGAEQIASITDALQSADLQKDLTLTTPLNTGYVAYDLEAPAKMLYPKPTPLRNKIPRGKGVGVAHQFKSIDGITGAAGSGLALPRPGITDASTAQFGQLQLNRGAKISYAGSERTVPYKQFGLSSSVPFSAQFAGEGFMDARQVDQASVLYSSMLLEERLLLGGRGTGTAFAGALAQPTGVTATARAAAAGETPISGAGANVYVKVTGKSIYGESVPSAVATVAVAAGQVVDVKVGNDVAGALGYNVYVGTGATADPGDASRWYAGTTGYNTFTVQGALPTAGTAVPTAGDSSASALDYDGILTVCGGAGAGAVNTLNAAFSTANPGTEFQQVFAQMYGANLADPDEVLLNGFDRKQLSDLLKTASSANYRLTIDNDGSGKSIGNVVTGLVNEVTGKMVDLTVHPYLPQGNAPVISWTLPFPDSNVDQLWSVKNVQDYMAIQWPVIQNSYDTSTYWFGTFFCYAPKWQGMVRGIKQA